ncbi:hypothetical protein FC40_GL000495 [Ligilactobacillus hayakitensis DSM 18933 = JCM 14209]|uniref:LSM domain-containing protein n=1 Tax=Ligilactobacillus hayakitensis DSM 18933 = JCM 14209 TaxID=1423755 RepID=A0A0R1WY73_9LACO|nr:hypothetical protein [Ligilactobacillus hayakitensis]KRM19196.1 hypothetical protein FC40_GL000495 [Ligilactobacillus hayakitensis DSM 18933 = JCM 14209]
MELERYLKNNLIRITFTDGEMLIGRPSDFMQECDDEDGANLVVIPTEGKLKGKYVCCFEHEVVNVEVIE